MDTEIEEPDFAPKPRTVQSGLYIVATPIGNLRDISLRALDVLGSCELVLCEDTRQTGKLLHVYGLKKPLMRYDDHCGPRVLPEVIEKLRNGAIIAQVSDAGTPLISDPGYRLVTEALKEGIKVSPLPGASSVMAALCVAGLPTDRFLFLGFMPNKSSARCEALMGVKSIEASLVFFESGPRLKACLRDMLMTLGDREACVCRELTKLYETHIHDRLSQLVARDDLEAPKGEIVIVIGPPVDPSNETHRVEAALREALLTQKPSEAANQVAKAFGVARKDLYRLALEIKTDAHE